MDREFLELIQTFDRAAGRLETLEETILTFNDVMEKLHHHLDELLELVYLDNIVTLAEQSNQKLGQLNYHLDQVAKMYESLVQVKQLMNVHALENEEGTLTSVEDKQYVYYVVSETNQVMAVKKEMGGYHGPVHNLISKKLVQANQMAFALREETGEVVLLQGPQLAMTYPLEATDFTIFGYELYYLTEQTVKKFHLLTQEQTTLLEGVCAIRSEKGGLWCQSFDGTPQFIPFASM